MIVVSAFHQQTILILILTCMSVEMCRYLFRKGKRGGWVRQRRVVNGKVRFRVCRNDRQSKVWYTFGRRHNSIKFESEFGSGNW